MADVRRWSQDIIEWADGDPAKGNLMVGSPLAVALALRGITRLWLGQPRWREDLDKAVAIAAQSTEPLTLALVLSWNYGLGIFTGVLRADDTAVRTIEKALRIAEASGDDYVVGNVDYVLGYVLLLRDAAGDRHRGRQLLAQVRDMCTHQRFPLSELTIIDLYAGRERAKDGDRDGAIRVIQKSVDEMFTRGQCLVQLKISRETPRLLGFAILVWTIPVQIVQIHIAISVTWGSGGEFVQEPMTRA
jgi:adenylate cyclase